MSSCSHFFSNGGCRLRIQKVIQGGIYRAFRSVWSPMLSPGLSGQRNSISTDLKRFLEEVGTDPKEARFWLRQFQHRGGDPEHPFAVLQIELSTLQDQKMMESLCSSLSFLHRNGMPTVLVYGPDPSSYYQGGVRVMCEELMRQGMNLVDYLEKSFGTTRIFCGSGGMIYCSSSDSSTRENLDVEHINIDPIKWSFRSGHIPLVTSLSIDHETGHVIPLCPQHIAIKLAEILKPLKVIFLNDSGGLVDSLGKVISHIKIPADLVSVSQQSWCSSNMKHQINDIANLLKWLPEISSAVITSPDKIIKELFTHQGSGTIFQKAETIARYTSFNDVDVPRLTKLLTQSFKRPLKPDYMEVVERHLCSVYISESYSAAAVIIQDKKHCEIPYLDKFVISSTSQGQGTSEALWDLLTHDFPCLFWRSRVTNRINPWYFIRADGSWSNGDWIVFWYGVNHPMLSHSLVEFATSIPESFDPIAKHDNLQKSQKKSTTSHIQYI